jgi:DNA-binding NtrC family response regulator
MDRRMRVFVVDDEKILLTRLKKALTAADYEVWTFSDPITALDSIKAKAPDIVITDVKMSGMDGIELLQRIKILSPSTEVIVITGYSSLDAAVEVTKKGAFYYLAKPFKLDDLKLILSKAVEKVKISFENERLRNEIQAKRRYKQIIGESPAMVEVFNTIAKIAKVDCSVIIQGESGTGKELIARALHRESPRAKGPFVPFNCASFTDELMANELFGHEKGAFTGATTIKAGLLETAGGGTLFLDEVADMPLSMQVKLLRVLQEHELLRVGGVNPVRIDIRVIAATNKDIKQLVEAGKFRDDLYYRLNVVFIETPPLRERKEDIPLLVNHFIAKYNAIFKKKIRQADQAFLHLLLSYSFPGNVRELENIVERAVALADKEMLTVRELPPDLNMLSITSVSENGILNLKDYENEYIRAVYNHTGNNQQQTAELLGISRTTLWRKLKELELAK